MSGLHIDFDDLWLYFRFISLRDCLVLLICIWYWYLFCFLVGVRDLVVLFSGFVFDADFVFGFWIG